MRDLKINNNQFCINDKYPKLGTDLSGQKLYITRFNDWKKSDKSIQRMFTI